jgi:4-hydroxy-tetrahydrodipicolinate synthase
MSLPIRGVIACLVTPFTSTHQINTDALRRQIDTLCRQGVDGLCVGGPVADLPGGTIEEFELICRTAVSAGGLPVLANAFADSTNEAIEFAQAAQHAGAAAIAIAQPHYLFWPDQAGIVGHFEGIGRSASLPVFLLNVLSDSLVSVKEARVLVHAGAIKGICQGGRDLRLLADMLQLRAECPIFACIEDMLYPALLLGAEGIVSSLAALVPQTCVSLFRALQEADHEEARRHHRELFRLWRTIDRPAERFARLRYAMDIKEFAVGNARKPYDVLSAAARDEVRRTFERPASEPL